MDSYSAISGEYKKQFIEDIMNGMVGFLDNKQLYELNKSLYSHAANLNFADNPKNKDLNYQKTNKILIKQFLKAKKTKGLSKQTLQTYTYAITLLEKWTIKSFLELTSNDLKEFFIFHQKTSGCGITTLNNYRRNLSSFFRFLCDEEKIIVNPMLRIPPMKEPKRLKKSFSYAEIEKLRWHFNKNIYYSGKKVLKPQGIRDLAMFEFLISSGIRVGELTSLKKEDIIFDECKAIVLGKGNKERVIYFSERAKNTTLKYLTVRNDNNSYLFISVNNKKKPRKLSTQAVESIMRKAGQALQIYTHPHKCRRYFCTQMIKKGMPIDQVQSLMGHESIETTLRYIDMDDETIEMTHKKYTNF